MTANAIIRGKAYVSAAALAKLLAEPQRLPARAMRQAARLMLALHCTAWQD